MVGESYPVIMSSGSFFAKMNNPRPVVQIGRPGEVGNMEWSDMIISTQGPQAGAVLIEWNLASLKGRVEPTEWRLPRSDQRRSLFQFQRNLL